MNTLEAKLKKFQKELEDCTNEDRIEELERIIESLSREIHALKVHSAEAEEQRTAKERISKQQHAIASLGVANEQD